MPRKAHKTSTSIAAKSAELAAAVPQVVARRMTRMVLAGSTPSPSDRREFRKMISEKHVAFSQAWMAMATETVRAHQMITASLFGSYLFPRSRRKAQTTSVARQMQTAANAIVSKGLSPIHKTAVANAKRLGKSKKR